MMHGPVADSPVAAAATAKGRGGPDMHEIRPRLWLGSYGPASDRASLAERGVTHILTVGVKTDLLGARQRVQLPPSEKDPVTRVIVAVQDASHARLDRHFDACSTFIADALTKGGAIFVHCQAGQSRSPTIVAAYLMREERLTALNALESIKRIRSVIRPNCGFLDQLRSFELRLNTAAPDAEELPCSPELAADGRKQVAAAIPSAGVLAALSTADVGLEIVDEDEDEEHDEVEAPVSPPVLQARQVDDLFGTEELRLRSDKLRAKYQQLRTSASLLALATPLRKRRLTSRQGVMR